MPVFVVCSRSCVLPSLLGGDVWVRASIAGVPAWCWLPRGSSLSWGVPPVSVVRVGTSVTVFPLPMPVSWVLFDFS